MNAEQEFLFLVPDREAATAPEGFAGPDPERDVSIVPGFIRRAKEVPVSRADLEAFWKDKVVGLTQTISDAQVQDETRGFHVDEISFSIGVGAKGGVFFVAEGSVEASMSVKLRRGQAAPTT
jgi:hypothetical protein